MDKLRSSLPRAVPATRAAAPSGVHPVDAARPRTSAALETLPAHDAQSPPTRLLRHRAVIEPSVLPKAAGAGFRATLSSEGALPLDVTVHLPAASVLDVLAKVAHAVRLPYEGKAAELVRETLVSCATAMVRYHDWWHAEVEQGRLHRGARLDRLPEPRLDRFLDWFELMAIPAASTPFGTQLAEEVRAGFIEGGRIHYTTGVAGPKDRAREESKLSALFEEAYAGHA